MIPWSTVPPDSLLLHDPATRAGAGAAGQSGARGTRMAIFSRKAATVRCSASWFVFHIRKMGLARTDIAPIRIPAGTRSGRTFRVKGRGIDTDKRVGDLLVTVDVAVPSKLTAEERRAVEALAAAAHESPRDYLGLG